MKYVFLNGSFLPKEEAKISVEDRGFLFGDGIYEVIRAYNGKLFRLDDHIERLFHSAEAIRLPQIYTADEIKENVKKLLDMSDEKDVEVYIEWTRGVAPREHAFPEKSTPTFLIMLLKPHSSPPERYRTGAKVVSFPEIRWKYPYIKTVNLLPNVLAKQHAKEQGAFEAIFVHQDSKIVTEGSSSNILMVKDGKVYCHETDESILFGITLKVVMEICEKLGIDYIGKKFTYDEMIRADEVFLSGTGAEIMPVVKVDDHTISDGKPGELTKKILAEFLKMTWRGDKISEYME